CYAALLSLAPDRRRAELPLHRVVGRNRGIRVPPLEGQPPQGPAGCRRRTRRLDPLRLFPDSLFHVLFRRHPPSSLPTKIKMLRPDLHNPGTALSDAEEPPV